MSTNSSVRGIVRVIFPILLVVFFAITAQAFAAQERDVITAKAESLEELLRSMSHISMQMDAIQKVLRSPDAAGREEELKLKIAVLTEREKELEASFEKVATDVDWADAWAKESKDKEELSW
ncbi:MAG: hypothetical protein COW41_04245, partial [Deltaproteobacteria bacterium CG17_big_fil_post_rev_8_21_14_2_50_51_6]